VAPGRNFLEVETRVIDLENAESIQEDLAFGDDEHVLTSVKKARRDVPLGTVP